MGANVLGKSRYEIRLTANATELELVRTWIRLHAAGFFAAYPSRRVNRLYMDTPNLVNVEENLAGISERRKLRYRWYGDSPILSGGAWELKCKRAGLGWKITENRSDNISLLEMDWNAIIDVIGSNASGQIAIALSVTP